jgi:hypothetical protein
MRCAPPFLNFFRAVVLLASVFLAVLEQVALGAFVDLSRTQKCQRADWGNQDHAGMADASSGIPLPLPGRGALRAP